MDKKYEIIEKNDKLITGIIVILATILTVVSLSMIAVSSLERTANSVESVIMTFLAGSIALSAHLLPALTKRRVGKIGSLVVTFLWIFSVLVTLYSHTVFFVSAGVHAGEVRSQQSGKVDDLKENMALTQQEINNPNVRSVVAIAQETSVIEGRIAALVPRDCSNCKTTKSRIVELEAKKKALDIEMKEAQRIAALKEKTLTMNDNILSVKDNARLDPVTEKLSIIFKGMNVDAITLFLAVLSSALLETLAALFWWLVWPNQKIKLTDKEIFSVKNNLNNSSRRNRDKPKRSEDPLFGKEMVSSFKIEPEITNEEVIEENVASVLEKEENKKIEENIDLLKENMIDPIRKDIKLKKKKVKGYKITNKKIPREFLRRKIIVPQLKIKESSLNAPEKHEVELPNKDNVISEEINVVNNPKTIVEKEQPVVNEVKATIIQEEIIVPTAIIEDVRKEQPVINEVKEKSIQKEIVAPAILKEEIKKELPIVENKVKQTVVEIVKPVESQNELLDLSKTIFNLTEENIQNSSIDDNNEDLEFSPSMFEDKMEVDVLNANKTFAGDKNKSSDVVIEKSKINKESLLKINKEIPNIVSNAISKVEGSNKDKKTVDDWFGNFGEEI